MVKFSILNFSGTLSCNGQLVGQPQQILEACYSTHFTEHCYSYHNFTDTLEKAENICQLSKTELLNSHNIKSEHSVLLDHFQRLLRQPLWIRKIDSDEDDDSHQGM